jgi:hypothetical protein
MEFTYRVSEQQYAEAWKLRVKARSRQATIKTVVFWIFILVCLIMLWFVIQKDASVPPAPSQPVTAAAGDNHSFTGILVNVAPILVIAGLSVAGFLLKARVAGRLYRKDPSMQGRFTVCVSPASFSMSNTAGISSQCTWNFYECWREGKDVVILVGRMGLFFVLVTAGLAEAQRSELCGILAAALPKK